MKRSGGPMSVTSQIKSLGSYLIVDNLLVLRGWGDRHEGRCSPPCDQVLVTLGDSQLGLLHRVVSNRGLRGYPFYSQKI
jgi:hypothetical protein